MDERYFFERSTVRGARIAVVLFGLSLFSFGLSACGSESGSGETEPNDTGIPDTGSPDTGRPTDLSGDVEEDAEVDTFSGECRAASDCEGPPEDSKKVVTCEDNQCVFNCEEGFQDADEDGECRENCATSDIDCGSADCIIDQGTPTCSCPTETSFDEEQKRCVLDPLLEDRSFEESDDWDLSNQTVVDTSNGELVFGADASTNGARAQQAYDLSPFVQVGPMKLTVAFRIEECAEPSGSIGFGCKRGGVAPLVLFDGRRQLTERFSGNFGETTTVEMCVGESAYDGTQTLTLMPGTPPAERSQREIDRIPRVIIEEVGFQLVAESECPEPQTVDNGDFEGTLSGPWSVRTKNNTVSKITERGGDRKLELGGTECTGARATQQVSIPELDGTAISFEANIPSDANLQTEFFTGDLTSQLKETSGGAETKHLCVPDADRGTVQTLRFEPELETNTLDCNESIGSIFLDDIRFTNRSECENLSGLTGGTFETEGDRSFWTLSANDQGGRA